MKNENLIQFFLQAAEQDRAKVHFWSGLGRIESFTYRQLYQDCLKVAGFLQERGLKKGQTVAVVLPTHPDFYRAFFGVL
ncbi:MAG: AMP-binding protein, partial [Deltaproteobacteria bacterium]|nr:AMP-binding protein [Deltaproteobacteria bacterium]